MTGASSPIASHVFRDDVGAAVDKLHKQLGAEPGEKLHNPDEFVLAKMPARVVYAAFALEEASYPADEAATHEKLIFRQKEAGVFFYGFFDGQVGGKGLEHAASIESGTGLDLSGATLKGFVTGTLVAGELTEESMGTHDPLGTTLCIHSVVIEAAYRRNGFATAMLKEYVARIKRLVDDSRKDRSSSGGPYRKVDKIALICKEVLVGLYKSCGFEVVGPSAVVHGQDPWIDMVMSI